MTVVNSDDIRQGRPGASGLLLDGIERWTTLMLGLGEVVTSYSTATLVAATGEDDSSAGSDSALAQLHAAEILAALPGATAALGLRLQRRVFDAIAQSELVAGEVLVRVGAVRLTSPAARVLHQWVTALDAEFAAAQDERAEVAATFLASAGPRTLDELLARIDLEAVLDRMDFEAVLDRVDMEAVLDRIDFDAAVDRVDVNALLDRVDLDAVVARLDVNELMSGAIADIQVAGLLRDSTGAIATGTGAIATGTVDVLRTQVGGVANRLTGRKQ
ncbi:MAG: hypothetical protein QG597_999 [Actinomycetota bacterium]|nr:hypothetical protein [Actinomycetota bacterium]